VQVTLQSFQLAYIGHPDVLTVKDGGQDVLQTIVCLEQV